MVEPIDSHIFPEHYTFEEFTVDLRRRALLRNGEVVALTAKIFSVLATFVKHPGVELSKEFLISAVWPDSCVEASNLTQSIFLLRRALGQTSDDRRLILTIPGRGYLFTGDVKSIPELSRDIDSSSHSSLRPSVAVLPFLIFDSAEHTQYLGIGIADALITRLSHLEGIDIRPTGAVVPYAKQPNNPQNAGRELGVNLLITGIVYIERLPENHAPSLHLTVQLINVLNGRLLWSDRFAHDLSHILNLQDALAEKLGEALEVNLTIRERRELTKRYTEDNLAYQSYLKGRYYAGQWTIRGWRKAIESFSSAVQRDPQYALAYCGIADAHYMASNLYSSPIDAMGKAKIAAYRALELDHSLAEAHTSVGLVHGFFDWDWQKSETNFRNSIALNSKCAAAHLWHGRLLATMGRFDSAVEELQKGQCIDPLSAAINAELGRVLYYARRFNEATEQLRETLELEPNFWPAHLFLGWIYEQQGHFTEAIAILRHSSALDDNPRTKASLGVAYAFSGDEGAAEKVLVGLLDESKRRYVSPYYIAAIHVALGNLDRAFRYFGKAYADRSEWLVWLQVDPRFDPVRRDPRFRSLVKRVGIPPIPTLIRTINS